MRDWKRQALTLLVGLLLAAILVDMALAQSATPFGVGRPDAPAGAPSGGIATWMLAQQSGFYRSLSSAIRAAKTDGSAFFGLFALSIAYGVFHAAGPGHGKAVISSYLLASGETLKRGIALSFAAAFVQALSAIALVSVLAFIFGATAQRMDEAAFTLERLSYACILLVGLWLVWRKARTAWGLAAIRFGWPGASFAAHAHGPDCDHQIAPDPASIAGPLSWRAAAGVVLSIGARPCTGAIIVLVFALAQGLFWAGIAAAFAMAFGTAVTVALIAAVAVLAKSLAVRLAAPAQSGGAIALALIELAAALFVAALGAALLAGALTAGG